MATLAAITTECYFAFKNVIPSMLWVKVREPWMSFVIYNELSVNLQVHSLFFYL